MINQRLCLVIEKWVFEKSTYFEHSSLKQIWNNINDTVSLMTITIIIWGNNKYQIIMYPVFHLLAQEGIIMVNDIDVLHK